MNGWLRRARVVPVASFSASARSLSYGGAGVQSPLFCEGVGNGSGARKALRAGGGRDGRGDAQYIVNNGQKLFTETGGPGGLDRRSGGTVDPRQVVLHDGRPHVPEFALERDGFRFVRHDTKIADFFDEDEVRRVYYPEMEALVKAESGASRVVVFDHTLRTADDEMRAQRKIREVVPRVHNDYTEWSGPQRVRDLLPEEADALLARRFAIIQVWRPIRLPVESFPLAICDARSV